MLRSWQTSLQSWVDAGLIDPATAERIRAFEDKHVQRWPALFAWGLGGLMLSAGVLLFVAAHWDELSPAVRFSLVLLLVAAFHVAGGITARAYEVLATVFHAVGTVALGAGIFLAAQIFHLQEHWPGGLLLWALGAWLAAWVRRDWVQAALAAVLTPAWLASEWMARTERLRGGEGVLAEGLLLLAIAYLTAYTAEKASAFRYTLEALGAVALIPGVVLVAVAASQGFDVEPDWGAVPAGWKIVGWTLAFALPLGTAFLLRGRAAWMNLGAAVWVAVLGAFSWRGTYRELVLYLWCLVGSLGLMAWSIHEERRRRLHLGLLTLFITAVLLLAWAERYDKALAYLGCALGSAALVGWGIRAPLKEAINVGVGLFALTVGFFYFSTVMDKLSRSASLIGFGLLFLIGGWLLERTRRRLIARLEAGGR